METEGRTKNLNQTNIPPTTTICCQHQTNTWYNDAAVSGQLWEDEIPLEIYPERNKMDQTVSFLMKPQKEYACRLIKQALSLIRKLQFSEKSHIATHVLLPNPKLLPSYSKYDRVNFTVGHIWSLSCSQFYKLSPALRCTRTNVTDQAGRTCVPTHIKAHVSTFIFCLPKSCTQFAAQTAVKLYPK